ncbi:UNVERIFIED_CONTAM: hypothetical protein K2H54_021877 [Gekko kuhli]
MGVVVLIWRVPSSHVSDDQDLHGDAVTQLHLATEANISHLVSAEVLREQAAAPTSASFVPANPLTSSDDIVTDNELSSSTSNLPDLKEQAPLSIGPSLEGPVSTLSLPEDLDADNNDEKLGSNESKNRLQKTLASLEVKLKVADEEKCKIKKDLEDLLEKYRILETDFLKDKEDKLISHQDRYSKLQTLDVPVKACSKAGGTLWSKSHVAWKATAKKGNQARFAKALLMLDLHLAGGEGPVEGDASAVIWFCLTVDTVPALVEDYECLKSTFKMLDSIVLLSTHEYEQDG